MSDTPNQIRNLCSSHNPILKYLKYLYSILQNIHSIWKPRYRRGLLQPGAQIDQVNKQYRNDDLAIFVGDRLEVKEADKDWLESAKMERVLPPFQIFNNLELRIHHNSTLAAIFIIETSFTKDVFCVNQKKSHTCFHGRIFV